MNSLQGERKSLELNSPYDRHAANENVAVQELYDKIY